MWRIYADADILYKKRKTNGQEQSQFTYTHSTVGGTNDLNRKCSQQLEVNSRPV